MKETENWSRKWKAETENGKVKAETRKWCTTTQHQVRFPRYLALLPRISDTSVDPSEPMFLRIMDTSKVSRETTRVRVCNTSWCLYQGTALTRHLL